MYSALLGSSLAGASLLHYILQPDTTLRTPTNHIPKSISSSSNTDNFSSSSSSSITNNLASASSLRSADKNTLK